MSFEVAQKLELDIGSMVRELPGRGHDPTPSFCPASCLHLGGAHSAGPLRFSDCVPQDVRRKRLLLLWRSLPRQTEHDVNGKRILKAIRARNVELASVERGANMWLSRVRQ